MPFWSRRWLLVFVAIMVFESDYTHFTRLIFFGPHTETAAAPPLRHSQRVGSALNQCDTINARSMRDDLAIEVPGRMSEHREHDGEAEEEG